MNGVFTSIGTHCHVLVPGGSFPCHRKTHYFFGGAVEWRMAARGQACGASWLVVLHLAP